MGLVVVRVRPASELGVRPRIGCEGCDKQTKQADTRNHKVGGLGICIRNETRIRFVAEG